MKAVLTAPTRPQVAAPSLRLASFFLIATSVGIATGLMEGFGLLAFQRINWAQWARMMHVSKEILWVSPLVDWLFFLLIALVLGAAGRVFRRFHALQSLAFLLIFLAVYDWLALTSRLFHRACLLLALGVAVACTRWISRHEHYAVRFCHKVAWPLVVIFGLTFAGIQGGKWISERNAVAHLPAAMPGSPNVIVIVIDTLRADHLSCYGYPRPTSPEIDQLASDGVLFENAIAPSSWSLPSHASLLTGRYPFEHGLNNVQPMPWLGWHGSSMRGYLTLGEALQQRGYRTGAFSANRVYFTSNVGLGRGFMHFEDYFFSPGDSFVRTVYGREFARLYLNRTDKSKITRAFRAIGLKSWLDKDSEGSGDYGGAYGIRKRASDVNRELLQWIDRDARHPFFAFVNYLEVHYSYGGPPEYQKPAWDRGTTIDEYDAGLKYLDERIGSLVRQLQARGLDKKTLLVITSDHGESLGDHGLTYHGAALYWELIHVPLILRLPGRIPGGVRIANPVTNAAIPATVVDLIGGIPQRLFPGPALPESWEGSIAKLKWPDPLSELAKTDIIVSADRAVEGKVPIATDADMESVVTPQWHLILHQKWGVQLYDWNADGAEKVNLVNFPEGRATGLRLVSELKGRLQHSEPGATRE